MNRRRFRGTIGVNKTFNTNSKKNKLKTFCSKWNRIIATIVGILLYLFLMVTVLYDVLKPEKCPSCLDVCDSIDDHDDHDDHKHSHMKEVKNGFCSGTCDLTCKYLTASTSLEEELRLILAEKSCTSIILTILESNLPENKIERNWLNSLAVRIEKLTIKKTSITNIEDDAFSSSVFEYLYYFTMEATEIRYLQKNALRGLKLNAFEFRYTSPTQVFLEEGLLEHVADYLMILQFNFCIMSSTSLANLTGSSVAKLIRLQTLDLGYNSLKKIESDVIKYIPDIRQIYLNDNSLEEIDVNAFYSLRRLRRLNLNKNKLERLPQGIFDKMEFTSNEIDINLGGNFWICDCEMQWLKDFYLENDYFTKTEQLICYNQQQRFEDVEFCPSTSTTITTTTNTTEGTTTTTTTITTEGTTKLTEMDTPTTTIETTTMNFPIYKKLSCLDWSRSPKYINNNLQRDIIYTQDLYTRDKYLTFNFYEVEAEAEFLIEVQITGNITDFHILWFNSYNTSDYGCVTNLELTVVLINMKQNHTYTVCLLYEDDPLVSPYDCFGLQTRVEYPYRAWIRNEAKIAVICISASILCSMGILSASLMFYCIWKWPSLIKKNKRVIIVSKQINTRRVFSREYERPPSLVQSNDSYSKSSYLTANGYTRIKYRNYRPPILRTVAENCVMEMDENYVRPVAPSAFQLNTWRINARQRSTLEEIIDMKNYDYEAPPPLPPMNNNVETINNQDENLYSVV